MGFLDGTTQESYYAGKQNFVWLTGDAEEFEITLLDPIPTSKNDFWVYIDGYLIDSAYVNYNSTTHIVTFTSAVGLDNNDVISVVLKEKTYGDYRYINLSDLVSNFIVSYVGDGKLISRANRRDVLFHTKRALQEFSYDIIKSQKIQEVEVGPMLSIPMPQDYVGLVSLSIVDGAGVEHMIPQGRITSKPSESIAQDNDYNYQYDSSGNLVTTSSITDESFRTNMYQDETEFLEDNFTLYTTGRFGANPELANSNGMYIIDEAKGTFNFSSNLSGKLITIKYLSDNMGNDNEMKVHKFAEEAIYKYVAYAILSTLANVPEYIINRYKKDRRSAMRNAKLRIYELRLPELTQVMRGKSKQIKH